MAPNTLPPKKNLGNVLIIGGCGFLGHHIVDLLISSYTCKISVLDVRTNRNRRPDSDGVVYIDGDITDLSSLVPIFQRVKADVVIHTASPLATEKTPKAVYYKVNVEGTKCVVEACKQTNVKALVYTSSASVISDNESDLINADERWPIVPPHLQTEYYSTTKAEAEAHVLASNRTSNLLTVALRPAGIFGEGDMQAIPSMLAAYWAGKHLFQLGDNNNLFDWTYVGNVAHAHALAAVALLHTAGLNTAPLNHEKVDGEVFIITGDAPVYFFDFTRAVCKAAGCTDGIEAFWTISRPVGMFISFIADWVTWSMGKTTNFKPRIVKYTCMTRYYNCGKAKSRLGYKPPYTVGEGVTRAVKWFVDIKDQEAAKKGQ